MHGNVTPIKGDSSAVPAVKLRTITLTNRAPIRINEDRWPVVAEGKCSYEPDGAPYGWSISIRVRCEHKEEKSSISSTPLSFAEQFYNLDADPRHIIHAHYTTFEEDGRDENNQTVRVGRLISGREALTDLWKHILEVGDELRERIMNDHMRKQVVHALDACFARLPPHENC